MKIMLAKMHQLLVAALAVVLVALSPAVAQEDLPPLMRQINNGNWLPEDEAKQLSEELYYQRAVQAYLMTLPYMNTIGMRDGARASSGDGYHILPIWKSRMDAKAWIPTPNADLIYGIGFFDLKKAGPLVVYAPANVIGMFTDVQQKTITDVGALGPDQAKGGLYLLLPANWAGEVPKGYFTFESRSNNVFLFFRTVMPQGKDGPDPGPAVALAEQTRVYPLWQEEKDFLPMRFPDLSGKRVQMMYPTDFTYWEKVKALLDEEAYGFMTPENRGLLAALGIVQGQPFEPTVDERKLLDKAVKMAPRMLLAQRQTTRKDKRELYYHDRNYVRVWAGGTNDWMQESYLDVDMRARFFQVAFSSAPAMVMRTVGAGSKYPQGLWDADGNYLNGSHTYKLHLPANIPAELFWAVTIYNITDGTMVDAPGQKLPTINGMDMPKYSDDGSIDLYFGPEPPDGVERTNFLKTVEGRDFMFVIRCYGTPLSFFDQTWKPDNLVKIK